MFFEQLLWIIRRSPSLLGSRRRSCVTMNSPRFTHAMNYVLLDVVRACRRTNLAPRTARLPLHWAWPTRVRYARSRVFFAASRAKYSTRLTARAC